MSSFHQDDIDDADGGRLSPTERQIWLAVASDTRRGKSKGTAHYAHQVGLSVESTYSHLSRARRKILALRERDQGDYEHTPSPEHLEAGRDLNTVIRNQPLEELEILDRNGDPCAVELRRASGRGHGLPSAPVVSDFDAALICEAADQRRRTP